MCNFWFFFLAPSFSRVCFPCARYPLVAFWYLEGGGSITFISRRFEGDDAVVVGVRTRHLGCGSGGQTRGSNGKLFFFITKWMSMYGGPREKDSFWDKGEMSPWVQRTNDALGAKKTRGVGSKVKRLLWARGKKAVVGPTGKRRLGTKGKRWLACPPPPKKAWIPWNKRSSGPKEKQVVGQGSIGTIP